MKHIFTLLIFIVIPILFINAQKDNSSIQSNNGTATTQQGGFEAWVNHLNSKPLNDQYIAPSFAGGQYADYGESVHDKGLTWLDEMSDTSGSLEEMRAKAKEKEQKKIISNIIIGTAVLSMIIFLVRRSKYFKLNENETNK